MNKFYSLAYYLTKKSVEKDMRLFSFTVDDYEKYQKELERRSSLNMGSAICSALLFLWVVFFL